MAISRLLQIYQGPNIVCRCGTNTSQRDRMLWLCPDLFKYIRGQILYADVEPIPPNVTGCCGYIQTSSNISGAKYCMQMWSQYLPTEQNALVVSRLLQIYQGPNIVCRCGANTSQHDRMLWLCPDFFKYIRGQILYADVEPIPPNVTGCCGYIQTSSNISGAKYCMQMWSQYLPTEQNALVVSRLLQIYQGPNIVCRCGANTSQRNRMLWLYPDFFKYIRGQILYADVEPTPPNMTGCCGYVQTSSNISGAKYCMQMWSQYLPT